LAYVYRYRDNADGIIKYVGIVWGKTTTLSNRLYQHRRNDDWCKNRSFTIEYIKENINTRTDAEYFEAHYISLYQTDKYFNVSKAGWGVSSFLPDRENDWIVYDYRNFKEEGFSPDVSELNMAKTLTDQLFSFKTEEERTSFGRRLRVNKNPNISRTRSDKEIKYWNNVIDLIDKEVGIRILGNNYDDKKIRVYLNGRAKIIIDILNFGEFVFDPQENTLKTTSHMHINVFDKDDFIKCLEYIIDIVKHIKQDF
jgi:hypothetical protein